MVREIRKGDGQLHDRGRGDLMPILLLVVGVPVGLVCATALIIAGFKDEGAGLFAAIFWIVVLLLFSG